MPRGRDPDPEGQRQVLLVSAAVIALLGIGLAVVLRGWAIAAGVFLVLFALGCVRVARDDGSGQWCDECVTRNPSDAAECQHCGADLV